MAVRIRMKKLGRRHRPFFRICAIDKRAPRDGRVIEELGYYDPMCKEKDARAVLNGDRIAYWLGVGAQPSGKCSVLIKKYGKDGTHLDQQQEALQRLSVRPQAPDAIVIPLPQKDAEASAEVEPAATAEADTTAAETETASEGTAEATDAQSSEQAAAEPEAAAEASAEATPEEKSE